MTFNTLLVAVWYSSDSCRSAVRWLSFRYVSALLTAITAWSAKVFSNSTWLSEKPPRSRLPRASAPMTTSPRTNGITSDDFAVMPRMAGFSLVHCPNH